MAWWAIYSEPNRALLAREELGAKHFDVLCPVERLTKRRKLPNRNQYKAETVVTPVFGRYLFADASEACELLPVRGVADVVRRGLEPFAVPARVIERLAAACAWVDGVGHLMGERNSTLISGTFRGRLGGQVKFTNGPFDGFIGVIAALDRLDLDGTLKAAVEMLGRTHVIDVSVADVRVLPRADRPTYKDGLLRAAA